MKSSERGQALVEYALILPLFALLLFGIMEFGIVIMNYNMVANAAREGARAGIVPPDDEPSWQTPEERRESNAEDEAIIRAPGLHLDEPDRVTADVNGGDETIRVTVTYPHELIAGNVMAAVGLGDVITLTATSTMQLE